MNWKHLTGALLVVVVLALGLGAAYYSGLGPAPGGTDSGDRLTDFPIQTPAADGTADGGTTAIPTATSPPFAFTIDRIEECGLTCRDVTATLHNNQEVPATGVTVYSRIYAGQESTTSDTTPLRG